MPTPTMTATPRCCPSSSLRRRSSRRRRTYPLPQPTFSPIWPATRGWPTAPPPSSSSHISSPDSENETSIGPVFRQVIEPPGGRSEDGKVVAWAPMLPSNREVAAPSEAFECIRLSSVIRMVLSVGGRLQGLHILLQWKL